MTYEDGYEEGQYDKRRFHAVSPDKQNQITRRYISAIQQAGVSSYHRGYRDGYESG